jgi:hypothetical protein
MSKLPPEQQGRFLGGNLRRGWGLHQSTDRDGQKGGDPLSDTLAKCQKVTGEKGGPQKDNHGYNDEDTKQPEDVRPDGGASFKGERVTDGCKCLFSNIIF